MVLRDTGEMIEWADPAEIGQQADARSIIAIQIEQYLFGALLLNPDVYNEIAYLEPGHFKDPIHARLWWGVAQLAEQGRTIGPATLAAFFQHNPELNIPAYIGRLRGGALGTTQAPAWAREVLEHWRWRQVLSISQGLQAQAVDDGPGVAVAGAIEGALHRLDVVIADNPADGGGMLAEAHTSTLAEIDAARAHGGGILGTTSGLAALDFKLGGYMPGDLIVMAGRPGMGKSAVAGWSAAAAAAKGSAVALFSIEMPREDLVRRWLSARTGLAYEAMRKGEVSAQDRAKMDEATAAWAETPLYIDDSPRTTVTQIRARSRRFAQKLGKPIGLIVVDYLQLIRPEQTYRGQRVNEMSEISAGLKAIAKDLKCPVLALSQLNREVEKRDNKRPLLSDLRDSGSIEQDADAVLLLYREEYYLDQNAKQVGKKGYEEYIGKVADCRGKLEINVAKNRHGATGPVTIGADMATARFW